MVMVLTPRSVAIQPPGQTSATAESPEEQVRVPVQITLPYAKPTPLKSATGLARLAPRKNTLAVQNEQGTWDYYTCVLDQSTIGRRFVRIDVPPNILANGIVHIDKIPYHVSVDDILRRRINASESNRANIGSSRAASTSSANSAIPSDQPRPDEAAWIEDRKNADLAWEDQVRALLHVFDS